VQTTICIKVIKRHILGTFLCLEINSVALSARLVAAGKSVKPLPEDLPASHWECPVPTALSIALLRREKIEESILCVPLLLFFYHNGIVSFQYA